MICAALRRLPTPDLLRAQEYAAGLLRLRTDSTEWRAFCRVAASLGVGTPPLERVPPKLRKPLVEKLAAGAALAARWQLSPIGEERLWRVYLTALQEERDIPLSLTAVAHSTLSFEAALARMLPYPEALQRAALEGRPLNQF